MEKMLQRQNTAITKKQRAVKCKRAKNANLAANEKKKNMQCKHLQLATTSVSLEKLQTHSG